MQQEQRGNYAEGEQKQMEIDLIGFMFFALEKFWLVVLAAIVGTVALGVLTPKAIPLYSSTAKLYIGGSSGTINISDISLGTALTMDYQEVFKTWEVHEMVRKELNLEHSYAQMQSFVRVTNPENTRILYITATYYDAQTAADMANAYATAAKEFIVNSMRGEEPSDFSIALVPGAGAVASRTKTLLMGFLGGSVLAMGVLLLLYILDDRPKTPQDINEFAGIPTLAVLPAAPKKQNEDQKKRTNKGAGRRKKP